MPRPLSPRGVRLTAMILLLGILGLALSAHDSIAVRADEEQATKYYILNAELVPEDEAMFPQQAPHEELWQWQGQNGRWGYIRRDDCPNLKESTPTDLRWSILPRFSSVAEFSEGAATVEIDGSKGAIDESGNFIVPSIFEEVSKFVDGIASVRLGNQWGFINRVGGTIIKPEFDEVDHFSEGVAAVCKAGKWGYIDLTGKFVIQPQFDDAASFSSGAAPVRRTNKWIYITKRGEQLTETEFDAAGLFKCGRATVMLGKLWGVIDGCGNFVVEPKFDDVAAEYSEGLLRVKTKNKWGYVDLCGNESIDAHFDYAADFQNGLAVVKYGNDLCIIDPLGNFKQRILPQPQPTNNKSVISKPLSFKIRSTTATPPVSN